MLPRSASVAREWCLRIAAVCVAASLTGSAEGQTSPDSAARAAVRRDSVAKDTTHHWTPTPIKNLGALGERVINLQRLVIDNQVNESFSLFRVEGAFPLSMESPGLENELLIDGMDTRGIAVTLAGRPLNNPVTGRFTFMHIAPEFGEDVEIVRGPRAAIFGFNATEAAINFIPRVQSVNRPWVRVRYGQEGFEHLSSDLSFSENVSRTINVNVGIDRQSQIGEWVNSNLQYWNLRGSVRWFADSNVNLLLTENFTHNHPRIFGGLVPADLLQSNLLAGVNLTNSDMEDTRHDVTLSLVQRGNDSLNTTNVSLYYSLLQRDLHIAENSFGTPVAFPFALESTTNFTRWYGLDGRRDIQVGSLHLLAGVSLESIHELISPNMPASSTLNLGAYGQADEHFGDAIDVKGFGRADIDDGTLRPTFGGELTLHVGSGFSLFASGAATARIPTLQERLWISSTVRGLNYDPVLGAGHVIGNETHLIGSAGLRVNSEHLDISLTASERQINRIVEALPMDTVYQLSQQFSRSVMTVSGELHAHAGWFVADGTALVTIENEQSVQLRRLPLLYARGGLYFHQRHFLGVPLELRTGVEGVVITGFNGETYLPGPQLFVPGPTTVSNVNGSLDWVFMAHIGDAYIRLGMSNIFDRRLYYVPYYPELQRQFHIGVTWVLFD